jgi:hypothetical protein
VVRDHNWGTIHSTVTAIKASADGSALHVRGTVGAELTLADWQLAVRLTPGSFRVDAEATVLSAFARNRLGLVVLHPPAVAGHALTIEHAQGPASATAFPVEISPHQPALDIRGLEWSHGDVRSRLEFGGDVFEMEDQRNWTDASFKTYSTPLSLPFPVWLHPGTAIRQSVQLSSAAHSVTQSDVGASTASPSVTTTTALGWPMPEILTSASTTTPQLHRSDDSRRGSLLVEIDPAWPNWRAALYRAITDAATRPIDLRIVAASPGNITTVLDEVCSSSATLLRVGAFDRTTHLSEPPLLAAVAEALSARGLDAEVLGGTRAHFTELNRAHERIAEFDGPITLSITPFMHDRSGYQLTESIPMLGHVAADARRIAGGRPLHMGPITLGARFNAVATEPARVAPSSTLDEGYGPELVAGASDARQSAASLGAWVLCAASMLAVEGVASLSWFEASGPRGLCDGNGVPTSAGTVYDWLAQAAGRRRIPLEPARMSEGVQAILIDEPNAHVILVGNLSGEVARVDLNDALMGSDELSPLSGSAEIEWSTGSGTSPSGTCAREPLLELPAGAAVRLRIPKR